MNIKKMIFKEVVNGGTIEYYISNKQVDEKTYNILSNDDSFETIPYSNILPTLNNEEHGERCECEDCKEIWTMVDCIKDSDDDMAFTVLSEYVDIIEQETYFQALIDVYSEMGNNMIKNVGKLEDTLNALRQSYINEDIYFEEE